MGVKVAAPPAARLELTGVCKRYGDRPALDGVDLTIHEGEFVSLIGVSGCGKSTLLNLVAGLTEPTAGSVTVAGRRVGRPGADRAMVFQDDAVFPWATVADNIAYGLRLRGRPRAERRAVAAGLARLVGLAGHERAYPRELSGGMRKRVDLARALALEPAVLLMDEPFGSLDAISKERLQEEFVRIHRERAMTVLFVTHDIEEALFLSDRVVLIGGGRIVSETGVPGDRPRSRQDPRLQELRREFVERLRGQVAEGTA
jgi:NitT/TauT family transport system ATP-binding protein